MLRGFVVLAGTFIFLAGAVQVAWAAEPTLTAEAVTVDEDATSGKAVVKLRLDRAAKKRITVAWKTVTDTATKADYVVGEGTVTFPIGKRTRRVGVDLRDDRLDEATERFFVKVSAAAARIPDARIPVRIRDDDPLPALTASRRTVVEGARGTTKAATLTLSLSRRSGRTVKAGWSVVSGTATAGVDLTGKGTATIPAGALSTTLPAKVVGDNVAEGDEAAPVRLSSLVNARLGQHGRVTIDDDDDPTSATDLYVKLDSARAASKAFTATAGDGVTLLGDTLTATAADGTVFNLTIPDGALMQPVTITMTPWADLEGIPVVGGALAGVDLKPNGLQLLDTAMLEIVPPGGGDVPAVSFAYVGGGREAHQYPLALDPTKLQMGITHFSGYGTYAGEGTSIEILPGPPVDPAQALADEMARLIAEERQRQLEGDEPSEEIWDILEGYMESYYNNVVLPLLGGIREDCAQAKANNGKVLGWARHAQLLFGETRFAAQSANVLDAVTDGAENCLQEAMEPCVDPDDDAQMKEIYRHWRTVVLLGGTLPDPLPNDPVWECKTVLLGSVTYQYDRVSLVGADQEFRHEEHATVQFQPRLVEATGGYWMDDGLGGWSMTGNYDFDDLRPDIQCPGYEREYSGSGIFNTDMVANGTQLNPETDEGLGNFEISGFVSFMSFPGMNPVLRGEVVGHQVVTNRYVSDGSCVEDVDEGGHWRQVVPCPTTSGGVVGEEITDPVKGRGVKFSCTRSLNRTETNLQQTGSVKIQGEFWLTKA